MEQENQLLQAILCPYQVCSIHIHKHFFRKRLLAIKIVFPPPFLPSSLLFFLFNIL